MFQLLPCPQCQRTFSVRDEVSESALLKCPNCGNQFRIGELLDALYAPWQILEDPAGTHRTPRHAAHPPSNFETSAASETRAADMPETEFDVGSSRDLDALEEEHLVDEPASGLDLDGSDDELVLAEEAIDESAAATSVGIDLAGSENGQAKVDWSKFKPISHDEYQRLRRGNRSGIWSTLQVVLGGAAAIPVSLLLIWYVLGKDVAGAGPAVAQYLPWLVPKQFHGNASDLPPASPSPSSRPRPRRGESGFRNFDDVLPVDDSSSSSEGATTDGKSNPSESSAEPSAAEDASAAPNASVTPEQEQPVPVEPGANEASRTAETQSSDAQNADAQTAGVQKLSPAGMFALLNRTKKRVDDWKSVAGAQASVKRQAAIDLFDDLCNLGVQLDMSSDSLVAGRMEERAQDICRAIKRQPDLVEVLHNAAKAQLNGALPRSKNGWALVCTVGEVAEEGDRWQIRVSDPTLVPLDVPRIEIPKQVMPLLNSGQHLLLLGKFVTDSKTESTAPAENDSERSAGKAGEEVFQASFSYLL